MAMFRRLIGAACLLHLLAGCQVAMDVTRHNRLQENVAGRTFAITPFEARRSDPEFEMFAERLARYLRQLGMRDVGDPAKADYGVLLDYGLVGMRTRVGTKSIYDLKTHDPTPTRVDVRAMTRYLQVLHVHMVDRARSTPDRPAPAWEVKVTSLGEARAFVDVADCMLDAAFKSFPGDARESVRC
jgi:hypothetical protein